MSIGKVEPSGRPVIWTSLKLGPDLTGHPSGSTFPILTMTLWKILFLFFFFERIISLWRLEDIWQNPWSVHVHRQSVKALLNFLPIDPKSIGFRLWSYLTYKRGFTSFSINCSLYRVQKSKTLPVPSNSWHKINWFPPLIINNLHNEVWKWPNNNFMVPSIAHLLIQQTLYSFEWQYNYIP